MCGLKDETFFFRRCQLAAANLVLAQIWQCVFYAQTSWLFVLEFWWGFGPPPRWLDCLLLSLLHCWQKRIRNRIIVISRASDARSVPPPFVSLKSSSSSPPPSFFKAVFFASWQCVIAQASSHFVLELRWGYGPPPRW